MNKKNRASRLVGGVVAAVAAVSLLAGCAGATTSSAAEIDPDATVTVGVKFLPVSWDPAQSTAPADLPVLRLVYDGLLDVDADRQLIPALAERWDTPDGGVTWEFELRDDAVFSNGDTFDAEDAKATLEYFRTEASTLRSDLALVEAVEVVDDHTLRVVNSRPNAGTPGILSGRAGLMMSTDVLEVGDTAKPIGTGRFVLTAETKGISFDLEAHEDFWQPDLVRIAGAHVQAIEDPISMANALRSGEIDLGIVDPAQESSITAAGMQTYAYPSQLVALGLNPNLAPELADVRVRNALSMAIDREGIVSGILFGHGEAANQFFDESAIGFDPDLAPIEYDLEEAKRLLAEAGYGDGFSFTVAVQAANRQLMEAIQASWAELGVDIELIFPAGSGVTEAAWGKNPTVPVAPTNASPPREMSSYLQRMLDPSSPRNPGKIGDERVTALIQDSYGSMDEGERAELFRDVSAILHQETGSYIPVVWRFETVAYSEDLVGVTEARGGFPVLDGLGVAGD